MTTPDAQRRDREALTATRERPGRAPPRGSGHLKERSVAGRAAYEANALNRPVLFDADPLEEARERPRGVLCSLPVDD